MYNTPSPYYWIMEETPSSSLQIQEDGHFLMIGDSKYTHPSGDMSVLLYDTLYTRVLPSHAPFFLPDSYLYNWKLSELKQ